MGFIQAPNIKGRIFVPEEEAPTRKKHTCPDCFECQQCGEDRCRVCRNESDDQTAGQAQACRKKEKGAA